MTRSTWWPTLFLRVWAFFLWSFGPPCATLPGTGGYDSSGGDDDDDNDNDDNDPALTGGGSSGIAGDARSRGRSDTTTVGDGADHGGGGGGGGGAVPSAADATRSFSSPKQRKAWLRNLKYRQQKQAAKTRQQPDS